MCSRKFSRLPNSFSHTSHLCGLILRCWILICLLRELAVFILWKQYSQAKFLTWSWLLRCLFSSLFPLNPLPQIWQMWFLSLMWRFTCNFRLPIVTWPIPQTWQKYFLTFAWNFKCTRRLDVFEKDLSHCGHGTGLSPVCTLSWSIKLERDAKCRPQNWHLYLVRPRCTFRCVL